MYKTTIDLNEEKILKLQTTLKELANKVEKEYSAIGFPYTDADLNDYFAAKSQHAGYKNALYDLLGKDLYAFVDALANGKSTCVDLNEEPMDECFPENTDYEK